ncbi:MAG: twin-arginine translocation signal domain-containing protein [Planctomycetes bacterium]|nr:twin-arginine translocation signal domain-containing protein [Planctomycetota bacterium]
MNRRAFLKQVALGAAAGAALSRASSAAEAPGRPPAAARPNIVYILADDMGYGDLACQNPKSKIPTPNLDRLAAQGVRFTDAHAPTAVCTPTRYAILTGRYCWRSRLQRGVLGPWGETLIEPGRLTVPAMLRQHGYATACIGKWHLGWKWATKDGKRPQSGPDRLSNVDFTKPIADGPTTRGFDSYFGTDVPNYPPYCFIENDRTLGIPSRLKPNTMFGVPGPMIEGWDLVQILPTLTKKAVAYVETAAKTPDKPFFLYFPLTSPHVPIVPAPEFKGKSRAGDYGDWVHQTDWTVGQVLDAIDRCGLAESTLVIFTSDNGPEVAREVGVGAYERIQKFSHASMGDLRGVKRDAWEGGHRVPFLAGWRGKIKPGAASDETICHVDLMATLAALLGARLPDDAAEDSYNVLPALVGEKTEKPIREAVVHHSCNGKFAIRQGRWVLIDAPTGDDNKEPDWLRKERGYEPHNQPGELYDLAQDPAERRNLYAQHPDIVQRLKALLEKYKAEGRSVPPAR